MAFPFPPLEPGHLRIGGYGWTPDLPDHRDFTYAAPHVTLAALPSKFDLRPFCPPVYDQGQLGSCTANAIAGSIEFEQMKQKVFEFTPSRLFIYYNERMLEGTPPSLDNGAQLRDGIKSVAAQGVCKETSWTYSDTNKNGASCSKCRYALKPTAACFAEGLQHKVKVYQRLDNTNLNTLKGCLAAGYPFVFGFTVYQSFESQEVASSGVVPMPGSHEKTVGGHAVGCVGYDDASQRFIVRNSWGPSWGLKGYCTMPYSYLTSANMAADFWTIQMV